MFGSALADAVHTFFRRLLACGTPGLARTLAVVPTLVGFLTACGAGGDAPREPSTGSDAASAAGDPAALLSSDPVDQINAILATAATPIPGEPIELRFQVRLLSGDSLAVDYELRELGQPWYTSATAVATLGSVAAELSGSRFVDLTCETEPCFEHRAPLEGLDLARLPEGEGRERFLAILTRLTSGDPDGETEGGEDQINRLLRASAISYSETVSSWYQVSFHGDWMRMVTWQHTEGFTEHSLPGWRAVHLPSLGPVGASDPIPCREPDCVLRVGRTPLRLVLPTTEDVQRLAELIDGLGGEG